MTELDYDTALGLLFRAVEEKGEDFVYTPLGVDEHGDSQCKYFEHGQPSCIVGHVLDYMGIDSVREGLGASFALRELGIEVDAATQHLLDEVQTQQDGGMPWGEALRRAQGLE